MYQVVHILILILLIPKLCRTKLFPYQNFLIPNSSHVFTLGINSSNSNQPFEFHLQNAGFFPNGGQLGSHGGMHIMTAARNYASMPLGYRNKVIQSIPGLVELHCSGDPGCIEGLVSGGSHHVHAPVGAQLASIWEKPSILRMKFKSSSYQILLIPNCLTLSIVALK